MSAVYTLRFYLDWMVYFVKANSRHGTHSPFVYRLVDEVIYPKRKVGEPGNRVKRLIARLIDRFQPAVVYHTVDEGQLPASPVDFVVVNCNDGRGAETRIEALWPLLHQNSVLVLVGHYRNKRAKRQWKAIEGRAEATVTIDLFRMGLVFFRAGQAKENFKIRY